MSYYLDAFLHYGSQLLQLVCLTICGLACWRISKVLKERAFAIAALGIGIFVFLQVFLATVREFSGFFPSLWSRFSSVFYQFYHVASAAQVLFLVLFAVGAVRRGLAAKQETVRQVLED